MHPAQTAQGLQVDGRLAHGQVTALDQRIAELACQVQMLEITFVEPPRRQQHHQRRLVGAGGQSAHGVLHGAKKAGHVLDFQVAVQLGKGPQQAHAVFQRIACAGGRLGPVGGDPPASIGRARQVRRIQVQERALRRLHALARPQVVVVPEDQLGGQQPLGNQRLRAIDIGQHGVEQACPLGDTRRDLAPFVGRNDVRQQVQFPRPIGPLGVGIDVVGDAVFLDLPCQRRLALRQLAWRTALQMLEQAPPVRAHAAIGFEHFMIGPAGQRVTIEQVRHGEARGQR